VEPLQDFNLDPNSITTMSLAASQHFKNDGPSTIIKRYKAEETVQQTATFEFSNSVRKLEAISIEVGNKMTVSGGIPLIGETSVETEIRTAVQKENEKTQTETQSSSTTKSKSFSVDEEILVDSCTEYEVSSFVQIASDVEINYKILYNVSGWVSEKNRTMSAQEVKKQLRGIEYVRDEGEYNVIAEGKAKFKTSYGLKTFLNATGRHISDCNFSFFESESFTSILICGGFALVAFAVLIFWIIKHKKYCNFLSLRPVEIEIVMEKSTELTTLSGETGPGRLSSL